MGAAACARAAESDRHHTCGAAACAQIVSSRSFALRYRNSCKRAATECGAAACAQMVSSRSLEHALQLRPQAYVADINTVCHGHACFSLRIFTAEGEGGREREGEGEGEREGEGDRDVEGEGDGEGGREGGQIDPTC